jgi:hypothetical protein
MAVDFHRLVINGKLAYEREERLPIGAAVRHKNAPKRAINSNENDTTTGDGNADLDS